ncbi:MAG: hypothetical protein WD804_03970 [Gemmatimonadota bacterium]
MFGQAESRILPLLLLAATGFSFGATPGVAQERQILANQVSVAGNAATLRLEFSGGDALSIELRAGRLYLDGAEAGQFTPAGALESSWRALLGQAIAADAAVLPGLLRGWAPPPGLAAESLATANALTSRIAQALEGTAVQALPNGAVRIHVDETVTIPMGETVAGSLLLVESDLDLDGRVAGDVVLIGGSLDLGPDAVVEGNVRWSSANVGGNRGAVLGLIQEVPGLTPPAGFESTAQAAADEVRIEERIRRQVEAEVRESVAVAEARRQNRRPASALSRIGSGIGGVLQTGVTFGILLAAGLGVLYFFPRRLEVIARTARETSLRSAMVGLAGLVLALPTFVVGIVLLAISIIGIPVILLWVPVFPIALAGAMIVGYLAVARNLGGWIFGSEDRSLAGFSGTSAAANIGIGLAALLAFFAVAHVFEMGGPWFSVFNVLLHSVGFIFSALAMCIGLGAIILSKGGQSSSYAGAAWKLDMDDGVASTGGP